MIRKIIKSVIKHKVFEGIEIFTEYEAWASKAIELNYTRELTKKIYKCFDYSGKQVGHFDMKTHYGKMRT